MMFKKLFKSFTQITVNSIDIKFIKTELAVIERLLNGIKSGQILELTDEQINRICV